MAAKWKSMQLYYIHITNSEIVYTIEIIYWLNKKSKINSKFGITKRSKWMNSLTENI